MNETVLKAIAAIAGITVLTSLALSMGYDGVLFLASVGIISGLGGVPILKALKNGYDVKVVQDFLRPKQD